jgi:hypothetical protein
MKYIISLLLLTILLASCKKNYNPSRGVFLGNYHFTVTYPAATRHYDGRVTIPGDDNGSNINMTYDDSAKITLFNTSDSSFSSTDHVCPHGGLPSIGGYYEHDSLFIIDDYLECTAGYPRVYAIGVKY